MGRGGAARSPTGLLHIAHDPEDIHAFHATPDTRLNAIPCESLSPVGEAPRRVMEALRRVAAPRRSPATRAVELVSRTTPNYPTTMPA